MKQIETLVEDIHTVLDGGGGWDSSVAAGFDECMNNLMDARLNNPRTTGGKGTLRMSNIGQPCARKLWYHVQGVEGEPLKSYVKLKFMYGDITEELLLSLAEAAGHTVTGRQDLMEYQGIKGHRDGVIDGMLIDVKSASTFGYKKFKEGGLRDDDPFGYITQLAMYLKSSQSDPLVTNKTHAGFLAMDKQHGHICLDVYDLTDEMNKLEDLVSDRKEIVKGSIPPRRPYRPVPQSKTSKNKKLPVACSYCEHKKTCWPEMRTFLYSHGPVFLTDVVDTPRVPEVK